MAPCEVKETTSPSIVLPTLNAATKLMKASGSLTAGGGGDSFLEGRFCWWVDGALGWVPLPSACFPAGASFLALALFWGAALLAAAFFLAVPRDFWGFGGWSASSTASSTALEKTGSSLARPGGGVAGVIGQEESTGRAAFLALPVFLAAF